MCGILRPEDRNNQMQGNGIPFGKVNVRIPCQYSPLILGVSQSVGGLTGRSGGQRKLAIAKAKRGLTLG